jgi:N-methylhydantoinase A
MGLAEPGGRTVRIAADIGGTFTDLVLVKGAGEVLTAKVSSTGAAPEAAVLDGIRAIMAAAGVDGSQVVEVLHGTTIGSNTLLERTGAKTGLITTRGFRDILEIGRVRTPEMFDLTWTKPEPLVPRRARLEVTERIAADGTVLTPLAEAEVLEAGRRLQQQGITSVAVCFINSYRNAAHERRVGELLAEHFPAFEVTLSAALQPEAKEYERTSTAVVNAYVLPVMRGYLARLAAGLAGLGIAAPLLVVSSSGGLVRSAVAQEQPVLFISSGPAAGVTGAARLGTAGKIGDLIVFDMGGTTAKAALIEGGRISRTNEYEFRAGISTPSRFIKAGGFLMRAPTIDIAEVGAGAGSIARIDAGGLIHVGPRSAGAEPGPACYGKGGDSATVTDANVVLGYLNPKELAGGTLAIDAGLSEQAVITHVAAPLGVTAAEAALGVREIANLNMARAIRAVTVERGVDPRDFTLVAFGGSGPVHACDLAAMLGIRHVLLPNLAGVFTAAGMLAGDIERQLVEPLPAPLDEALGPRLQAALDRLAAEARAALAEEGFTADRMAIERQVDLRFENQDTELGITVEGAIEAGFAAPLRERFLEAYERVYEYRARDRVEVVAVRVVGRGHRAGKLDFTSYRTAAAGGTNVASERQVMFAREAGFVATPVIDRSALPEVAKGPLIVESLDTTAVIPPGAVVRADEAGNLRIELEGRA